VKKDSKELHSDSLIFFEDAGYHRPEFREIVMKSVSGYSSFFSLNEEELQNYLGRGADLLNAENVIKAFEDIAILIPSPILIIHTKVWSVILGTEYLKYKDCVNSGIIMATTRYIYGDNFTKENFEATKLLPRNPTSSILAGQINNKISNFGLIIPAFEVSCTTPTTIGLGDSFVGGFLLELSKNIL
jgi:ADP-dependent phosphofructokinase/glucokinase